MLSVCSFGCEPGCDLLVVISLSYLYDIRFPFLFFFLSSIPPPPPPSSFLSGGGIQKLLPVLNTDIILGWGDIVSRSLYVGGDDSE